MTEKTTEKETGGHHVPNTAPGGPYTARQAVMQPDGKLTDILDCRFQSKEDFKIFLVRCQTQQANFARDISPFVDAQDRPATVRETRKWIHAYDRIAVAWGEDRIRADLRRTADAGKELLAEVDSSTEKVTIFMETNSKPMIMRYDSPHCLHCQKMQADGWLLYHMMQCENKSTSTNDPVNHYLVASVVNFIQDNGDDSDNGADTRMLDSHLKEILPDYVSGSDDFNDLTFLLLTDLVRFGFCRKTEMYHLKFIYSRDFVSPRNTTPGPANCVLHHVEGLPKYDIDRLSFDDLWDKIVRVKTCSRS